MIPILARARIKGSRSRKVESSCISGLSNSPLSSGITRESKAQGVFNKDSDNLDEELKSLCVSRGEGPDIVLGALRLAWGLLAGQEDRPHPPFSLRWVLHDPARLSRMVGAYLKQD